MLITVGKWSCGILSRQRQRVNRKASDIKKKKKNSTRGLSTSTRTYLGSWPTVDLCNFVWLLTGHEHNQHSKVIMGSGNFGLTITIVSYDILRAQKLISLHTI